MTIQVIREVLETHCLARDLGYESGLTQKCTGCPWIGWDHRLHQAKIIDEALRDARAKRMLAEMDNLPTVNEIREDLS